MYVQYMYQVPSCVMLWTCILEAPSLNLDWGTNSPNKFFIILGGYDKIPATARYQTIVIWLLANTLLTCIVETRK
jgi:hypothetical protein